MDTTKPTLYQPNVLTQARYLFSEYEMRVFLFVIKHIQDKLNKNDVEFNQTLFGEVDYRIRFQLSELMGEGEKNHARVKKALISLRNKSFEIEEEKQWFNVGFINYGRHLKQANAWEIQVSFLLMPYMVSLAKGYTAFQLATILHLNTYSQRLYLMYSQYRDTGIFTISAEKLRHRLALDEKYHTYGDFKKRVITSTEEELKKLYDEGKCDIWVKLASDKKERGKEDFDRILTFKIFDAHRKFKQDEQAEQETLRYCITILKSALPDHEKYCNELVGYLVGKKKLKPFAERLERLESQAFEEGNPLFFYGALIRHIAKEDFKFKK